MADVQDYGQTLIDRPAKAPPMRRMALEALWPIEAASFFAVRPALRTLGLSGDDHPVLVLPGFISGDEATLPLRWAIRGQGYHVHAWRLGTNIGPTPRALDGIRRRLTSLHEQHDRRVSVVGWSLGGIYARFLAREMPDLVRQVITLGSPYRIVEHDRGGPVRALYNQMRGLHSTEADFLRVAEQARPPLSVPATSIYTRNDGVAAWQHCIDVTGDGAPNPRSENIEVLGSHVGLGFNPAVLAAVLDRLGRREDDWEPFRPPLAMRPWYPPPATWRTRDERRQRRAR